MAHSSARNTTTATTQRSSSSTTDASTTRRRSRASRSPTSRGSTRHSTPSYEAANAAPRRASEHSASPSPAHPTPPPQSWSTPPRFARPCRSGTGSVPQRSCKNTGLIRPRNTSLSREVAPTTRRRLSRPHIGSRTPDVHRSLPTTSAVTGAPSQNHSATTASGSKSPQQPRVRPSLPSDPTPPATSTPQRASWGTSIDQSPALLVASKTSYEVHWDCSAIMTWHAHSAARCCRHRCWLLRISNPGLSAPPPSDSTCSTSVWPRACWDVTHCSRGASSQSVSTDRFSHRLSSEVTRRSALTCQGYRRRSTPEWFGGRRDYFNWHHEHRFKS